MVNYGSPSKITEVKNLRQVKQKYTARKIKQIHTQRLVDQITQAESEAEIRNRVEVIVHVTCVEKLKFSLTSVYLSFFFSKNNRYSMTSDFLISSSYFSSTFAHHITH